jgi:hypothetical protein
MNLKSRLLWWQQSFKIVLATKQKREFSNAFSMDSLLINNLTDEELKQYYEWLAKKRNIVHKMTI